MEINITKINLNPNAGGGNSGGGGSSNTTSFQFYNAAVQKYLSHESEWYWEQLEWYATTYGIDKTMILIDGGWKNYYYDGNEYQYIYDANGNEYTTPFVSSDIIAQLQQEKVRIGSYGETIDDNAVIMGSYSNCEYYSPNGEFIRYITYVDNAQNFTSFELYTPDYNEFYITHPLSNDFTNQIYLPVIPKGYIILNNPNFRNYLETIDWSKYEGCKIDSNFLGDVVDNKFFPKKLYNFTPKLYPTGFCTYKGKQMEEYEWDFTNYDENPRICYRNIKYLKPITLNGEYNIANMFEDCKQLMAINGFIRENVKPITNMSQLCFGCESLVEFNGNGIDTSECTNMYGIFGNCHSLKTMDISDWDLSSVTQYIEGFIPSNLVELKFGKNLKSKLTTYNGALPAEGVMEIINGLFDFVSAGVQPTSSQGVLKIPYLLGKLSNEQIAVGTAKGWTITK